MVKSNINILLAKEKGLIKDDDDTIYQLIVKKYKYLLEYYLSTIIDFKKYENEINNSDLYISSNTKYKNLNVYLDLDYIFLINNLFIEKLDENDLNLLKNWNDNQISDELIDIIKRTYKDVIKDNYFKNEYHDKLYKVCYGPVVPINFVDNDSLVFKIIYGKNKIDLETKEFIALTRKQNELFNNIINKISKEVSDKLGIKCQILFEKDIL